MDHISAKNKRNGSATFRRDILGSIHTRGLGNNNANVTFYQVIDGKSYEKETVAQIVGAGTEHATTSTVSINETGDYYAVIEVVDGAKVLAESATKTVSFSK